MENITRPIHEGALLKEYFKREGYTIKAIAAKLGMTRQNLYHHMRKEVITDDFIALLYKNMRLRFNRPSREVNRKKRLDDVL